MSEIKLHVIKPSVNNMTARVFIRATKLDFTDAQKQSRPKSWGGLLHYQSTTEA